MQGSSLKIEQGLSGAEASAAAGEIAATLQSSLGRSEGFAAPFSHLRTRDLFPEAVADELAMQPLAASDFTVSGKRELIQNRIYLDAVRLRSNACFAAVALAFQSAEVAHAFQVACEAQLEGTYLRIEYAVDAQGFWLEPHTDLGVKKLTGLIPLSGDEDLGTDLYADPAGAPQRLPFCPNTGTFFVPSARSWHGFAPRPMKGLRKSLIVNYVGPHWQSREQLAFPDSPISVAH